MDQSFNAQISESDTTLDLLKYGYLLWQWAWMIILVGVLAGSAAYIFSIYTTPIYETTTRLLVSDPPATRAIDYSAMVTGQTMAQTYSKLLIDTPVLDKVIERLNLTIDSEELSEAISVQVIQGTQIISIRVEDPLPAQAVAIANTIGEVFAERIRELQSERYSATRESLQNQVADMDRQINDTNAQLAQTNDPAQKTQLDSRLTEYRKLYSNLVTNYEQVRLAEAQSSTNVAQVQPARLPKDPIRPQTTRNTLLAVVAGIIFAAGAILVVDAVNDTIRDPDEIRQKFNLPVLGMIARHTVSNGKPIAQDQPRSPVAESFRALRTNIMYAAIDTPLRRIIITSATPQNGKTTITANLGVVMAKDDYKVTIVDADMRRPQLHRSFGISNRNGLSSLFINPLGELNGTLQSTNVPGLKVVASGKLPPNPSELLVSRKMIQILDLINQDSELILIDTPPLLSVTDAAALAPMIDGVILVVRSGVTRRGAFKQSIEQLQSVRARILGVVINNVSPKHHPYGYYNQDYYGTREDESKKSKKINDREN